MSMWASAAGIPLEADSQRERRVAPMQAQIRELQAPAVAAGIAVLGGVAVWQWGLELERAWLSCDGGPLPGDSLPQEHCDEPSQTEIDQAPATIGERRRWVSRDRPGVAPGTARPAGRR
jgi:hypothetical protein